MQNMAQRTHDLQSIRSLQGLSSGWVDPGVGRSTSIPSASWYVGVLKVCFSEIVIIPCLEFAIYAYREHTLLRNANYNIASWWVTAHLVLSRHSSHKLGELRHRYIITQVYITHFVTRTKASIGSVGGCRVVMDNTGLS